MHQFFRYKNIRIEKYLSKNTTTRRICEIMAIYSPCKNSHILSS
ncbi:hypothetical protein J558_1101 [Acinetobacter baumannii 1106579]|nr:hypothetical protein J527_2037 [Acinetobacter baumannii 1267820]EXE19608.1 hypothetical protein J558_1101 [Acinetobacter baumannii 1106579]EXE36000.1 hypothetical protein J573_3362 [Acinetobacter baumannii 1546444]EXI36374.1 hypothetical protein J647_3045 [Acinetobacter baumannii 846928]